MGMANHRFQLRALAPAIIVACAGLGVTAWLSSWVAGRSERLVAQEFQELERRAVAVVEDRFRSPQFGVKALRGLLAALPDIRRESFRAQASTWNLARDFPGVTALAWVESVPHSALEAFELEERRDGALDFLVTTAGQSPMRQIVRFAEPLATNFSLPGLDIGADAIARTALDAAAESGEPALSGLFRLSSGSTSQEVMALFMPVYRSGQAVDTAEHRLAALRGWVMAPIQPGRLLLGVDVGLGDQATITLQDASQQTIMSLVDAQPSAEALEADELRTVERGIRVYGRPLVLTVTATPQFQRKQSSFESWGVWAAGGLLSLLLATTVGTLSGSRQRARMLAARMTKDLDRLALVARNTSDVVIVLDESSRVGWVNRAYVELTGKSPGEVTGLGLEMAFELAYAEPASREALLSAVAQRQPGRISLLSCRADGQPCWLDLELRPVQNDEQGTRGFMVVASDVTDQRRMLDQLNHALRENEDLLHTIHSHLIVSVTDSQGTIIEVNDAFVRISGYSADELVGQNHRIVNSGVQDAEFWRTMWDTVAQGQPWRAQVCNRARDGHLYWVDSIIAPISGADGLVDKYISIRYDITDSKGAAARMAQANVLLSSILGNLPCGLSVFDAHLTLAQGNEEFYRLLDIPGQRFPLGVATYADIIRFNAERGEYGAVDVEAHVALAVERAHHPQPHHFERDRGAGLSLDIRGVPLPGGGFVTTYTDITDRKRAETQAASSSALLSSVLASTAHVAIMATDASGLLTVFNHGAEQLLGFAATDVVGVCSPTRFNDPEEIELRREQLSDALQRPVSDIDALACKAHPDEPDQREWTLVRQDGSTFIAGLTVAERLDGQGQAAGVVVIAFDATERKRFEQGLREARRKAEDASQAKGQFLANMSHEIRTPMNAILGMLKLLQSTELSTRQADYAGKADGAARSLLGLLNDILDYSKVEAGKMTLDPQPFRLDQLMRDMGVIFAANLGTKQVEVLFDIAGDVPRHLLGDSLRLQQVLINLGGNAIKFTERGEVVIRVRTRARNDESVLIEFGVHDTGIGIAPENQRKIFDGFSQAEASTTRRFGGTGLGLAISRRLVNLMGSELVLTSALGEGTHFTFELRLPVVKPEAVGEDAGVGASANALLSRLKVLVVDDNPTALKIHSEMARSLGWQVDVAHSGAEALDLLAQPEQLDAPYEAVFVDWQMPGMDGWETSQRIREQLHQRKSPVVVMVTAHGREMLSQRSEAEQALLGGFLVKPVTASMLLDTVANAQSDLARPRVAGHKAQKVRRLTGVRLLIVEDNRINQQVARELLEAEGALITLAGNGVEGVSEVTHAAQPYDAVLMDLQMPIMDGFAATFEIRRHPDFRELPIIAMTANAMQSDREACLAAGMNDHVGKPFDLNQLVKTILKYVPEPATVEDGAAAPVLTTGSAVVDGSLAHRSSAIGAHSPLQPMPPIPGAANHAQPEPVGVPVGPDVLDLRGALDRMGCGDALYIELLPSFLDELPVQLGDARRQIQAGAPDEARRAVHTIKGLAATMGAMAVSRAAAAVEAALKEVPASGLLAALLDAADQAAAQADALLRQALPFAAQGGALEDFVAVQGQPVVGLVGGEATSVPVSSTSASTSSSTLATPVLEAMPQAFPSAGAAAVAVASVSDGVGGLALLNLLGDLLSAGDMTALDVGQQLHNRHGERLGGLGHDLHRALQQLDFLTAAQCCADIRSKGLLS
jgi:PAS domain S-box-containing protein